VTARRGTVAAAAVSVALIGGAAPALAAPSVPLTVEGQQCEVGKTRYVADSSSALSSLSVPQSWSLATGKGITVAVVDSGVDSGNAHLGKAVLPGASFVPGAPTEDLLGHGTGVAGIIAARYVQGSALIGVAPEAKILPVRVFQDEDSTGTQPVAFPPDTRRMAAGISWAVRHGADVINVSMSTRPTDAALPQLKAALGLAHRKDVVVVASGGNQDQDAPFTQVRYPAGGGGVIGVAASSGVGEVDSWSIHGPQNDVSAPGSNVLIAFHANGDCIAGQDHAYTSWATGFVSGLAAQLRERFPQESADQIAYRIMASADRPRLSERDDVQGWGEIRPYSALTMSIDPNRTGPPLPGAATRPEQAAVESPVTPLAARSDPLAPAREQALWWGLGAVGLCALALVLRPWLGGVRLGRRTSRGRRRSSAGPT
jgi:type VII secretion-associated serine protease mycosin